jgi:hypothetical protein
MRTTEPWITHSDPRRQTLLAVGCILVGVVLAFGFRGASLSAPTNEAAGFLLGMLLLVVGVGGFLARGRQTVTVHPGTRMIIVADENSFGSKQRVIRFSEIDRVGIGYLGRRSTMIMFYYLVLHLANGEEYSLFAPGRFYAGSFDRSVVEGWQERLERYLAEARAA